MYAIVQIKASNRASIKISFLCTAVDLSKVLRFLMAASLSLHWTDFYHPSHPQRTTMKIIKKCPSPSLVKSLFVMGCFSVALGLTGCGGEDSAEKAGQKIDQAAANTEEKIEQVTEDANEKIEDAHQAIDQQAHEANEYIAESVDASKNAIATAGNQMDKTAEKAEKKIAGAKEVVADHATATGEFMDDSMITTAVKLVLVNNPLLKTAPIEVTTVAGVVKLTGAVDSESTIAEAIKVVGNQKNVKSVQNELTVIPAPV